MNRKQWVWTVALLSSAFVASTPVFAAKADVAANGSVQIGGEEESGFFSRTWDSMKGLWGSAKEDSKAAAHATGEVMVEGGHRAVKAGQAVGSAVVDGAVGVKDAIMTPSGDAEAKLGIEASAGTETQ